MLRLLRLADAAEEIHGCELDPITLDSVRRAVPNVLLSRTSTMPPTIYRDGVFDLVYAYSVFSHLSPEAHAAWGTELRRIVRLHGHVCVTTQGENAFPLMAGQVEYGELAAPDALARYRAGDFMYSISHPNWPHYGHASVPRAHFEKWNGFKVVDWDESGVQARCLLRAKAWLDTATDRSPTHSN